MPEGDPQASTATVDPIRVLEQEIADDMGIEGFHPDAVIGGEDEPEDSTDSSDESSTASDGSGDEVQESEPDAQNTDDEDGDAGGDDTEGERAYSQAQLDAAIKERVDQSRVDIEANYADRIAKAKATEDEARRRQEFDALTPEEQGAHLRNEDNRNRLVAELMPETEQRVLANLQANLGPQFITGFGYDSDPESWPDSTKKSYGNEKPNGLVAHVLFLHKDSLEAQDTKINDEWETKWTEREKALRKEFGVSMDESRGATDRSDEAESRVSANGSPTGGDFEAAELAVAAGTATVEQTALYQKRMYPAR